MYNKAKSLQWTFSKVYTLGTTWAVQIREVPAFKRVQLPTIWPVPASQPWEVSALNKLTIGIGSQASFNFCCCDNIIVRHYSTWQCINIVKISIFVVTLTWIFLWLCPKIERQDFIHLHVLLWYPQGHRCWIFIYALAKFPIFIFYPNVIKKGCKDSRIL